MAGDPGRNELARGQRLSRIDDVDQRLAVERQSNPAPQSDALAAHAADDAVVHVEVHREDERLGVDVPRDASRRVFVAKLVVGEEPRSDLGAQRHDVQRAAVELQKARDVILDEGDFDHADLRQLARPHALLRSHPLCGHCPRARDGSVVAQGQ